MTPEGEVIRAMRAIGEAIEAAERPGTGKGLAHVRDVYNAQWKALIPVIRASIKNSRLRNHTNRS